MTFQIFYKINLGHYLTLYIEYGSIRPNKKGAIIMKIFLKKDQDGHLIYKINKKTYDELSSKFYRFMKSLNHYPEDKLYPTFMAHLEEMLTMDLEITDINYDGNNIILKTVEFRGLDKFENTHVLKISDSLNSDVNFVVQIEELLMKLAILKPIINKTTLVREETMNIIKKHLNLGENWALSEEQKKLIKDYIRIQNYDDFRLSYNDLPNIKIIGHTIPITSSILYGGHFALLFAFTGDIIILLGALVIIFINIFIYNFINKKVSNELGNELFMSLSLENDDLETDTLVDPLTMDIFLEDIMDDIQSLRYIKSSNIYLEKLESLANEYIQSRLNELINGENIDKFYFINRLTELETEIIMFKTKKNITNLKIPNLMNRLYYLDISDDILESDSNINFYQSLLSNKRLSNTEKIIVIREAQKYYAKKTNIYNEKNIIEEKALKLSDADNLTYASDIGDKSMIITPKKSNIGR